MTAHHADEEESWVLLEACPEPVAAEVIAGRLQADGIPARISTLSPIPGLASNAEVYVPSGWLERARQSLAAQLPSDEELTELAMHTAPPEDDGQP